MFKHTHVRGNYLQFYIRDLSKIPIIIPDKTNFRLAREISHLANQLTEFHLEEIQNQDKIKALERELDSKVSAIYEYDENVSI